MTEIKRDKRGNHKFHVKLERKLIQDKFHYLGCYEIGSQLQHLDKGRKNIFQNWRLKQKS